jgi:hypothetical protein
LHHAGQRLFGHQHRQAGFLSQQAVQMRNKAPPVKHHAALGDVGTKFRRRVLLQRHLHGSDDVVQGVGLPEFRCWKW